MLKSKRHVTQKADRAPYVSAVSPSAKRQGRRLKKTATVSRSGNVTRVMLQSAPDGAIAAVNKQGVVKMLTYYRTEE